MSELQQKCLMCFNQTPDPVKMFSQKGRSLKIAEIISKHFWFEIKNKDKDIHSTNVCKACWEKIYNFHEYYCHVEELFQKFLIKTEPDEAIVIIPSEIDDKIDIPFKVDENEITYNDDIPEQFDDAPFDDYFDNNGQESIDDIPIKEEDFKVENEAEAEAETYESIEPAQKVKSQHAQKMIEQDNRIREYFDMQCDFCEHRFLTFLEARAHYREVHNITGYLKCCGVKIFRRGKLIEHINYHINPNEFQCKLCQKAYSSKKKLQAHQRVHNPNAKKEFVCDICGKQFLYKEAIRKHMMVHVKEKDKEFVCDDCDKRFTIKSILVAHIKNVHMSAFLQVCEVCARTFKNKYILEMHRKLHYMEESPRLKCGLCQASLKNESSLRAHMRRHADTEHACKLCGKVAPNRSALGNHMRYVHSERVHKCSLCDKAFKKPVGLREHMASHTGTSLYSCPYCPRTFTSGANMHKHRKIVHPVQWLKDRKRPVN